MAKFKIDAIEVATIIHKGDFSSLHGKSFLICDNMKKKRSNHPGDNTVKTSRLDRIEESIASLAKEMNSRFNNLEKDINARLDHIEKRLDYNNLKQLPKSNK